MTDREAMKMALEALLTCGVDYDYDENSYDTFDAEDVTEAIDALRQALAQPEPWDASDMAHRAGGLSVEQEPVGWFDWDAKQELWVHVYPNTHGQPLYAAQPEQEQAERDEAILHLNIQGLKDSDDEGWREVARLRALLAQPKQEPVAWMVLTPDNKKLMLWGEEKPPIFNTSVKLIPLYAAPPNKEWVSLTDEEMKQTCYEAWSFDPYAIAQAIQEKLRSKNEH